MTRKTFTLPDLPYGYDELAPVMSEEQLRIHHDKHHAVYVKTANEIIEKFDKARDDNSELDYKGQLKALSFNIGGHVLHSLFWKNMAPVANGGGKISGEIEKKLIEDFGSWENFKKQFTAVALGVEGSGWAALVYYPEIDRLMCAIIEKHNQFLTAEMKPLLVMDMFEHTYYIDYKNEKAKFVEAFFGIINWQEVNERFLQSQA